VSTLNPLSALMNAAVSRREVKLRGTSITLQLLSTAQVYDLLEAVPAVQPPIMMVGGTPTPNVRDQAYVAAMESRQRQIRLGELGIAMGVPGPENRTWDQLPSVGERRAWLIFVVPQIEKALQAAEVNALEAAMREMEQEIERGVRGN